MIYPSPVGELFIESDGAHITRLDFAPRYGENAGTDEAPENAVLAECVRELNAYFSGELKTFTVPVRLEGTAFRRRVWDELTRIPYGETVSYKELAERVGNVKACRAVGGANHYNPISIIVPCHRVIGGDGGLTGYGGGLRVKKYLLELERRYSDSSCEK